MILAVLANEVGLADPAPQPVPDASARAAEAAGAASGTAAPFRPGALLVPTPILQAVSRFDPVALDLW